MAASEGLCLKLSIQHRQFQNISNNVHAIEKLTREVAKSTFDYK